VLLLVAKAHETLSQYHYRNLGRFCGPRNHHRMRDSVRAGFLWAADNDCFNGFNETRYVAMLEELEGVPGCLFVTCPDVVGDADATFKLYLKWGGRISQPVGYVAQDGATIDSIPWNGIAALFVGGSTEWKLSDDARRLADAAQGRGKWVHMGRVNSARRLKVAKSWGVDSIDGTELSWFTDTKLPARIEQAGAAPQLVFLT
jgi:hypothetical protein